MAGGGRQSLTGSGVARGIAIGRAHLLAHSELEVRQYTIERRDVVIEIGRLTTAFNSVRQELDHLKGTISADAPSEVRAFLDLHTMILDDALLAESPRDLIRTRLINAEWALTIQLEEVCRQFEAIDDEYLRERSADVRQVVERVLGALAEGRPARVSLPRKLAAGERLVLVAQDMAPADVLHLKDRADIDLAGFVTERGGPTSHTAILARSLGLPAVVGVGGARAAIGEGDLVIIDGDADAVVVNPTEEEVASVHQRLREQIEHRSQLRKLRGRLSRTQDGVAVELLANIELPQDARDALEAGADGIGLFRSEFLFMDRGELPSEDEQY
jgi:phosphoenolpyruvate-protein phosphotransferase (PTS system enzyme I)